MRGLQGVGVASSFVNDEMPSDMCGAMNCAGQCDGVIGIYFDKGGEN